jgi:hypothetical protein
LIISLVCIVGFYVFFPSIVIIGIGFGAISGVLDVLISGGDGGNNMLVRCDPEICRPQQI